MSTTENLEKLVLKIACGFHFVIKKAKSHILLNGDLNEVLMDTGASMFKYIKNYNLYTKKLHV